MHFLRFVLTNWNFVATARSSWFSELQYTVGHLISDVDLLMQDIEYLHDTPFARIHKLATKIWQAVEHLNIKFHLRGERFHRPGQM